jgi:hypothetical protein
MATKPTGILDEESKAEEKELIAQGYQPVDALFKGLPWTILSGDPLDNQELASLIDTLGLTPDAIQALVEQYYDEAAELSVAAARALEKISEMMGDTEAFDFAHFVELLDRKTEETDFQEHAQNTDIHLTDDDLETLAQFPELLAAVQAFVQGLSRDMEALELLVSQLRDSLSQQALDLSAHIASDMHIQPEDQELIMDHVNDMGEYRHLTVDQFYNLMDAIDSLTGDGSVYGLTSPAYYVTTGGENEYRVYTSPYPLFGGLFSFAGLDALGLTFEQMRNFGELAVGDGTTIYIKAHQENTAPGLLFVDGVQYGIMIPYGEAGNAYPIEPGDIRRGYFYRLKYSADANAFVVTGASRIADTTEYGDELTAVSMSEVKRVKALLESEIDGHTGELINHEDRIAARKRESRRSHKRGGITLDENTFDKSEFLGLNVWKDTDHPAASDWAGDNRKIDAFAKSVTDTLSGMSALGRHVGTFDTYADQGDGRTFAPTNVSGFPNGVTVNDFIDIRADETRGGAATKYIAHESTAEDATDGDGNTVPAGTITWAYDITYSTDVTGLDSRVTALEGRPGVYRATCSTAAGTAAKVASLVSGSNPFSLVTGVIVVVTFTGASTTTTGNTGMTLNIASTGAYAMQYKGAAVADRSFWVGDTDVTVQFTGSAWAIVYLPPVYSTSDLVAGTTPLTTGYSWDVYE